MDDLIAQLGQQIHEQAHHAAEEAVNAPQMINRVVGESMRHISGVLEMHSASYLPVRPEEILVPPENVFGNNSAVVLLDRMLSSKNSFTCSGNVSTDKEGKRKIDLVGFKLDRFTLSQSKFLTLSADIGNEIIRQVNALAKQDGMFLVQCVLIENFFPAQAPGDDQLFSTDITEATKPASLPPVEAPKVSTGGLPPVDATLL